MARNSRSTFRRGISDTQRRKKAWIDMNAAPVLGLDQSGGSLDLQTIGANEQVAVLQFPSQSGFLESTILRIRGSLTVPKSTYDLVTPFANVIFAFGIGIVSDDAAAALAVPNPATATGYDWDGWMFLRQSNQSTVESQATMVDVKAMRKWKSGDSIVFVVGVTSNDTTPSVPGGSWGFSLRGLFLLP